MKSRAALLVSYERGEFRHGDRQLSRKIGKNQSSAGTSEESGLEKMLPWDLLRERDLLSPWVWAER